MASRRVIDIWCSESFQGTKADALRLAMTADATAGDMFEKTTDFFDPTPDAAAADTDHPDQLFLDLGAAL